MSSECEGMICSFLYLAIRIRAVTEESVQSLKMLYCYAHEDRQWPEEIDLHLSDLKRQCHIISQFDGELFPGAERKEQLLAQLPNTDLVLLLISAHFRKVEAFWDEISHEAWAVRWLGGCRVIALLLESVDWSDAPFASREILPTDARPLTEWQSREQAFHNIEQGMRVAIEHQWLARGDLLRNEGGGCEDEKALAAYDEALRLNPSVKQAWYGKAHVLNGLKRYEEALSACDEALRLVPAFSWVWYAKGRVFATLNRHEEALHAYDEALQLDPSDRNAWYWKGKALKALGRRREARQAKRKAGQLGWR
jgi:tetratricopeptide (TPR) repeat protein